MGPLGFIEIAIIFVIVLLFFGGKKIPELMRGLGKGVREFTDAKNTVPKNVEEDVKQEETSTTVADGPFSKR